MRWRALFDDLEAQAEALARADEDAELRDRVRGEIARLQLSDRLATSRDRPVQLRVMGVGPLVARLRDVGVDWLLLEDPGGHEVLVARAAVLSVSGLTAHARAPGSEGEVERRLNLRWAMRGLARDRAGVTVVLRDGSSLTGTLDRVGADYAELAEHPAAEDRRPHSVRSVSLLPLDGVALVRRR